jgi:hypothetical protein
MIAVAHGAKGSNKDYLEDVVTELEQHGIVDDKLISLKERVFEILEHNV